MSAFPEHATVKSHLVKRHHNFTVVRGFHVYTIFDGGYVNITGIKYMSDIDFACKVICKLLKVKRKYLRTCNLTIHTITASGSIKRELDIFPAVQFFSTYKSNKIKSTHYNRERFPAIIIRTIYGTILLYSKKYIFVGCNSKKQLSDLFSLLNDCVTVIQSNVLSAS